MADMNVVNFLIVDDDRVDIMAMQRTLKKLRLANPIRIANDGIEALEILRGAAGRTPIPPPFIVTLDLNMPRMSGLEFLSELRSDSRLSRVIVFVCTTSEAPDDIDAAYDRHVAGYIVKDAGTDSFERALSMVEDYSNLIVFPSVNAPN